jgi:asparagine synthetase B (glutamine-hydrolysing)
MQARGAGHANEDEECGLYEFRAKGRASTSRLEAIVRAGDELDLDTLGARLLVRAPARPGATAWKGIDASVRSPSIPSARDVEPPSTERHAVLRLREELTAAVERSLEGVRRVAVMAGGGLDSSGLLALAVEWAEKDATRSVFAVAMDYDTPGDDRPYMRALEQHLDCEVLRVTPEQAAPQMRALREGIDAAPLTWPTAPFEIETLERARQNGAERCLNGVAGDGLFDGAPSALSAMARRGDVLGALRAATQLEGFDIPRSRALSWIARPMLARAEPHAVRRRRLRGLLRTPSWAGPRLSRIIEHQRDVFVAHAMMPRETGADRFAAAQAAPDLEYIGWLRHQEEIASRLPRRDPYLDPTLRRFVLSLPPEWLLHGGKRRGLYREAIRELVPDVIYRRTSKADTEPGIVRVVDAAGGVASLRDLARVRRLADLGLVEPRAFARLFDELAADPTRSWDWATVFAVLAVEAFVLRHAR